MRVAAFAKYGSRAASTRQRLLQYLPYLESRGIEVGYHFLLGDDYVQSLTGRARFSKAGVVKAYAHRLASLIRGPDADAIWIYAELFPYLPAWFESLAFRSGKPVIYDFDDAFFHQYDENPNPLVRRLLAGKLAPLVRGATICCCGNAYLQSYAQGLSGRTMILPTVVDTDLYRPASERSAGPLVIGWIGSPSTWRFVRPLLPLLAELSATYGIRVRVIGAGARAEDDRFDGLELVEWTEATEVDEVRMMDIGIMPLPDEPWARGKSGYKLIQYMACAMPVVASPVGVNCEIVQPGANGFLAGSPDEWRAALVTLIEDSGRRGEMGARGRARAEEHYSLAVHAPRLAGAFLRAVEDRSRPRTDPAIEGIVPIDADRDIEPRQSALP